MKAIGIILAGGNSNRMKGLSRKRAIAALPIAGSFRCIDFALSNMTNSKIQTVAVLTQYNNRSLNEHLNSSKWWDFGRKQGGLYIFSPTITPENSNWYLGTADAMYQNLDFLKRLHEPYVVITSGDTVYKLDYNKVLDYHVAKKADITVCVREMPEGRDLTRYGIVTTDEEGRITEIEEKPMVAKSRTISTGIYVIRRRLLIELLERNAKEGRYDFVNDILYRHRNVRRIMAYPMEGYWSNIADADDYYRTNLEFLSREVRHFFFREEPFIYSKIHDLPPAKFNPGSAVPDSLIAAGCIVNGRVEHSVLFKQVFIGKGCVIRNSVILPNSFIADGSVIENCIVESNCAIRPNSEYRGSNGEILVVSEPGTRYTVEAD